MCHHLSWEQHRSKNKHPAMLENVRYVPAARNTQKRIKQKGEEWTQCTEKLRTHKPWKFREKPSSRPSD